MGRVHVYLGGDVPFGIEFQLTSPNPGPDQRFGLSLAGLGDYDGRGRSLVAVSCVSSDGTLANVRVYEWQAPSSFVWRSAFEVVGATDDLQMAGVGDVDGDGTPELGFGLPGSHQGDGEVRIHGPFAARASLPPAARPRVTTTTGQPIALRGLLDASDDLRFTMRAWLPVGRTRLSMEWNIADERYSYVKKGEAPWTPSAHHIAGTDLTADQDTPLINGHRYRWRVRALSSNPFVPFGPWLTNQPNSDSLYGLRVVDTATATEGPVARPGIELDAAPNPFNPRTVLEFGLPAERDVDLRIYDSRGRSVRTLVRGPLPAGTHRVDWDGADDAGQTVASGVYHAVVKAGDDTSRIKVTLVK
jgi:hypothetical protein